MPRIFNPAFTRLAKKADRVNSSRSRAQADDIAITNKAQAGPRRRFFLLIISHAGKCSPRPILSIGVPPPRPNVDFLTTAGIYHRPCIETTDETTDHVRTGLRPVQAEQSSARFCRTDPSP